MEKFTKKNNKYNTYYSSDDLCLTESQGDNIYEFLWTKVEEVKERKWKPEKEEIYYYIDDFGDITRETWEYAYSDSYRYDTENCFKTEEEAQQHLDNIKTEIELRKLAEELNNGEEIDWEDNDQAKYALYYNYMRNIIEWELGYQYRRPRIVYCLDKDFRDRAIEKIGEEKIKKYLMEE